MLIIEKKIFNFDIKEVYFSDFPFDVEGCDVLKFMFCKKKADINGFTHQKKYTLHNFQHKESLILHR